MVIQPTLVGWLARQNGLGAQGYTKEEAEFALTKLLCLVKRLNLQWEEWREGQF